MNFEELYRKIAGIDQGTTVTETLSECGCDDVAVPMTSADHSQPDSVTMSVNINGSGSNGIRDLMDILRNIDDKKSAEISHDMSHNVQEPTVIVGNPGEEEHDDADDIVSAEIIPVDDAHDDEQDQAMDFAFDEIYDEPMEEEMPDSYENSVDGAGGIPRIFKVAAVTATGDDLSSKGSKSPSSRAPGTNPLRQVDESLVRNLHNLYNEVKHR